MELLTSPGFSSQGQGFVLSPEAVSESSHIHSRVGELWCQMKSRFGSWRHWSGWDRCFWEAYPPHTPSAPASDHLGEPLPVASRTERELCSAAPGTWHPAGKESLSSGCSPSPPAPCVPELSLWLWEVWKRCGCGCCSLFPFPPSWWCSPRC